MPIDMTWRVSKFGPQNSRFLIPPNSTKCQLLCGFMPPNSLVSTLKNNSRSQVMVWQGGHVTVLKGVHSWEKKECRISTLYTEGQTLSWNFLHLSQFFSPCTSAKLCAPIWPPSTPSGFGKINNRNTPGGCEQLRKETMLHSGLMSIWSKSNNIWKTKWAFSYLAWFMTTLQVLHLSPKALIVSPHRPSILRRDFIHQLGRSTNFHQFLQVPGLGCLDLFRSKASSIIFRACNGWIMPTAPTGGEKPRNFCSGRTNS